MAAAPNPSTGIEPQHRQTDLLHSSWLVWVACLIAPLFWAGQGLAIALLRGPLWQTLADPAYVYLVGSAEVATGMSSFAAQHPGTPLYLLMAVADWATHVMSGSAGSLYEDVVNRPESFLLVHDVMLVVLQSAGLLAFGIVFARHFGLGAALVGQGVALLSRGLADSAVSPIPLQIAIFLALLAAIGPAFDGSRREMSVRRLALVGALMALGFTTKMTFFPALALPLLLFRPRQLLTIYAWCVGFGSLLVLVVVRDELLNAAVWWRNLFLTSGRTPGDADTQPLFPALRDIPAVAAEWTPVALVALAVTLGCLVLSRVVIRESGPAWLPWRGMGSMWLVIVLSLLATLKTYRPWDLVLIPIASAVVIALAWAWVFEGRTSTTVRSSLRIAVPGIVLIGLAAWSGAQVPADVARSKASTEYLAMVKYAEDRASAGKPIMTSYGVFTPATALYFGQWLSHRELAPEIVSRNPGWLEYKLENGRFYYFTDVGEVEFTCAELKSLISGPDDVIYIPGRELTFPEDAPQYSSITTEKVGSIGPQEVLRLVEITCAADEARAD